VNSIQDLVIILFYAKPVCEDAALPYTKTCNAWK